MHCSIQDWMKWHGSEIRWMGKSSPSAWSTPRLIRVPSSGSKRKIRSNSKVWEHTMWLYVYTKSFQSLATAPSPTSRLWTNTIGHWGRQTCPIRDSEGSEQTALEALCWTAGSVQGKQSRFTSTINATISLWFHVHEIWTPCTCNNSLVAWKFLKPISGIQLE